MTPSTIRDRLPYQPIVTRSKLRLPGDARVAVWTIVNVENWSPSDPMPRAVLPPPMGQPLLPDAPNWTCPACVESVFDFTLPALRTEVG